MLLCPSLMCADFLNLGSEVDDLCVAGADIMHLDVMDGHYVPNYALSLGDVQAICQRSSVPCDVHLMVTNPYDACEFYVRAGASIVYVHPESDNAINSTLLRISRLGAHPGIAVNPGLSFSAVEDSLPVVDYVLLMTVNPGFAGQKYLDYVTPKIERFARAKEKYGFKLLIDGACSPEVISKAHALGADGAVLGTSALFGKGQPYKDIFEELRQL
ncbi:MAG: ribulose-phosphate 3-epimerase [Olsenella sp.]|nr:ribulose-phosphate 3-epimerase [Olsenella sp.]